MSKKTAIIIGAGYSGVALANLLGKAGYKVDVFEKNDSPGGRIAEVKRNGFTFDLGPSWYLMPEVFEQYYSHFNLSAKKRLELRRLSPGYKVFPEGGESIEISGNYREDQKLFEAIEPGSSKNFLKYIEQSKVIYNLAMEYFLYNNYLHFFDFVKLPLLTKIPQLVMLVFKNLHAHVKKRFSSLVLQQLLEYQTVFLGGSPFKIPAMYSLMSHLDYDSGVYYPKKGMSTLVKDMLKLSKAYDITYHYSNAVHKINTTNKNATGITLEDGMVFQADIIVSNADLAFTETHLVPKSLQTYPKNYWHKRQPGPSAFILSLGVKGALPQLLHHNLYFVKDWQQNFRAIYDSREVPPQASLYICNPTKTDPHLAPANHENLFVLMPFPANKSLDKIEAKSLATKVINNLSKELNIPDLQSRIVQQEVFLPQDFASKFNAWGNNAFGGESHLLSQSAALRTRNKSRKINNLYYVGAGTLPGIGLPMCLISAELTYKRIKKIRRSGPLKESDLS